MKLPKIEVARGRWVDPDKLTPSQDDAATKILAEKSQVIAEMGPLVRRLGSKDRAFAERATSRLPARVRRITEGVAVTDVYFAAPVPLAAVREDKRQVEALVFELDSDG